MHARHYRWVRYMDESTALIVSQEVEEEVDNQDGLHLADAFFPIERAETVMVSNVMLPKQGFSYVSNIS